MAKKKEKKDKAAKGRKRDLRDDLVKGRITEVAKGIHQVIGKRGQPRLDFPARTLSNVVYDAKDGWFELRSAFVYGGIAGATSKGELRLTPVNQQAVQMDDFALCVKDKRPTRVPGDMGRRDMAIVEAIYASAAAGGQRVPVKA